jgi:hypothetical protein
MEVDKYNPQSAARLITHLGNWRHFSRKHQLLMVEQLEKIQATGVSENVRAKLKTAMPDETERTRLNLPPMPA